MSFSVLALSTHSVFEGLAVGLEESTEDVWTLFAGVCNTGGARTLTHLVRDCVSQVFCRVLCVHGAAAVRHSPDPVPQLPHSVQLDHPGGHRHRRRHLRDRGLLRERCGHCVPSGCVKCHGEIG